ncbi:Slit1-like protein [Schistosoma japonicum]|uniref:Slit1-like protein n=1 Tax=Schistosoma japonicum TaxID=6182 RepID=A0A4Z2DQV4_SCHJA|nr:Slit1-like protein [Schistosoma japonicum]
MWFYIWNLSNNKLFIILVIFSFFIDPEIFSINFYTTGLIISNHHDISSLSTNYHRNTTVNIINKNDLMIPSKLQNKIWAALPKDIDLLHTSQLNSNDKEGIHRSYNIVNDQSKPKFRRESIKRKFHFKRRTPQKYLVNHDYNNELNRYKIQSKFMKTLHHTNLTCPNECKCHLVEVECKNAQLDSIPLNIPLNTEKL